MHRCVSSRQPRGYFAREYTNIRQFSLARGSRLARPRKRKFSPRTRRVFSLNSSLERQARDSRAQNPPECLFPTRYFKVTTRYILRTLLSGTYWPTSNFIPPYTRDHFGGNSSPTRAAKIFAHHPWTFNSLHFVNYRERVPACKGFRVNLRN